MPINTESEDIETIEACSLPDLDIKKILGKGTKIKKNTMSYPSMLR